MSRDCEVGSKEGKDRLRNLRTADVEDAGGRVQVWEEGFRGRRVHVRSGDCGAEADSLGGVVVGGRGGEVRAVNLGEKRYVNYWFS